MGGNAPAKTTSAPPSPAPRRPHSCSVVGRLTDVGCQDASRPQRGTRLGEQRGQRKRIGSMQRIAFVLLALVSVASVTLGVARAGGQDAPLGAAAASGPLLGITGDVARFKAQTGQASSVHQAFLGWEQGHSYGSTFAVLFRTLAPIPMIHLGTKGQNQ